MPWTDFYLMSIGDAKNDGVPDILLGSYRDFFAPQIVMYDYSGNWAPETFASGSTLYNAVAGIAVGDADNDGLEEVIYGFHRQGNAMGGPLILQRWDQGRMVDRDHIHRDRRLVIRTRNHRSDRRPSK